MQIKKIGNYFLVYDANLKQIPGKYKLKSQAIDAFVEYEKNKVSVIQEPVEVKRPQRLKKLGNKGK